ncbi:hypothetical protein BLNAU_2139 [Blattamonas nauphoetae]|uniref:Uncharacterized protein n=1 Tax=Blattamonas nauphoetae TaxID=2049346 RepID=A0ABQ9YGD1_9EUKA|nr:hypothetical protein BLNAU_2139 [Blattamonas nauphoetae]
MENYQKIVAVFVGERKVDEKGRDETQGTFMLSLDYFTVASDDDNIEITEPNNLWMFERSGHNGRNGEYTRELTESSTLSFTETAITLAIPQKEIAASIAVEAEWHARLVFGDGSRTESFRVKLSGSDERKALTKQAMKWVVPVICAFTSHHSSLTLTNELNSIARDNYRSKQQKCQFIHPLEVFAQAITARMDIPSLDLGLSDRPKVPVRVSGQFFKGCGGTLRWVV